MSLSFRPNRTPLACARFLPSVVLARIKCPLELRQPAEHSQHQPPMHACCIRHYLHKIASENEDTLEFISSVGDRIIVGLNEEERRQLVFSCAPS